MTAEKKYKINWLTLSLMMMGCALMGLKVFIPAASPYMPGSILIVLLLLIMGGVIMCAGLERFIKYFESSLLLLLIPILSLFRSLIIGDGNAFSNLVSLLMLIVWPVFSSFILEFKTDTRISKLSRVFLLYIYALLIITMATTFNGNMLFPGASRDLAHFETDTTGMLPLYINMNIGGFNFIYTITLVCPLLAYWMKTNIVTIIIGVATFLLALLCIISSQYTIALLMLMVSLVLCFFPRRIRKVHVYSFAALFLVVLVSGPLIGNFFLYLSDEVEGKMLSARLYEVYQFMNGSGVDTTSDTAERMKLIEKSWDTFFNNLVIGSSDGIGGHSYLVDSLAQYGLWGLVAIIVSFRYLYRHYIAKFRNTDLYYYALASYMINLVQCYVNTYNGLIFFTLVLPMYIVAFQDKIENQSLKK